MVRLTIDGTPWDAMEGSLLIDALSAAGKAVPHLCHDKRLAPSGACRLCLVHVQGQARPVASCTTEVANGMAVQTRSNALDALCRTNLELIAARYPKAAYSADPRHPFHQLLADYGVQPGDKQEGGLFQDDSHPYLGVGMDRCVYCERCVRICEEVQGQFIWATIGRGDATRIATGNGPTLLTAGCVSCGACVDSCPSGALFDKRSGVKPTTWTRTTCAYCGVGCQMEVGTASGRVVAVRPADSPVNRGHLCVKGRYAFEYNHASDRITQPMLRRNGRWQPVGWSEALDFTAAQLQAIVASHGPDAVGVLASSRATNEENYLAQKFARVVLGTHNVDCCARVCHTPSAKALKTMLGLGAATNSFDEIEQANAFLICGANPTENHPVVGARIKQAVLKGARLVVIDPRRTELAALADVHLPVRVGCNVPLFNALAAAMIEEGWVDRAFLAERVSDFDAFAAHVAAFSPESVAEMCGVPAAAIRAAARIYAEGQPAMCFHGLGVTEHLQGSEGVMALINLALLTGNFGKPGSGINPLRGQNNVQGAAQMGCDPVTLTGGQSISQAGARFEQAWGVKLPTTRGLDVLEMMDSAQAGRLKALWVMGYDIYLSLANAGATGAALAALDLVIVQDLFINQTAEAFGTVFLPAASSFEKEGTFMNSDRRVQRVRAVAAAPGLARPDWWIIQALAARMGKPKGFEFEGAQQIWDEVRSLWPDGTGLAYSRLERGDLHWPCLDETHPGTAVLHREHFVGSKTAALVPIAYVTTPEQPDDTYPLLLTTGRVLDHFNAGTMSYRTPNATLRPSDTLDMAPADAARYGLVEGEAVRLSSRRGSAILPVHISDAMPAGQLFCSFQRPDLLINQLTSSVRDRLVHAPEYKVTAVRVEKVGRQIATHLFAAACPP
ncbi:formate dehydrogenase subunit alpha [Ralstonia pseudosolanacearum]|uniref:formate dehydrogenase subunit alpha n=1 Tax=Ralstonia pseudosolanacearum TaxID=1310165 RepID=UPI003CEE5C15